MNVRRFVRGVAAAVAAVALAGCWPMVGQGPHRQGYNPYERTLTIDNVTTLTPEWDVAGGDRDLVAADRVVVASGTVVSGYDLATGAERWRVGPAYRNLPYGAPVLDRGIAYIPQPVVGIFNYEHDLQTGEVVPVSLGGGGVVAISGDDVLLEDSKPDPSYTFGTYSFRVDDRAAPGAGWGGVTHVQTQVMGPPEEVHLSLGSGAVYSSGYGLLTTTAGDGASGLGVRAFGPEQPATCGPAGNATYACPRWVTPIDGTQATPPVVGPGETTLYVATDAGTVYAVDAATGAVQWSAALGAAILAPPALAEGLLYVPLSTGDVQVLATDGCGAPTCSPLWTAATGGIVGSQPSVAGGVVYVGVDSGHVLAFDATGCGAATCSPVWSHEMGGPVVPSPIVTSGRLIVTAGGRLVSLRPTPPPAAAAP